ncbi:hypothetical protein TNCV_4528451 [Trichonephila clavipes]|nr:hypothetical protein TNCV_4528451 [Trichonephila clavipes]
MPAAGRCASRHVCGGYESGFITEDDTQSVMARGRQKSSRQHVGLVVLADVGRSVCLMVSLDGTTQSWR